MLDGAEAVARRLWPRPLRGQTGYLLLTPAVLLVGLLAIGLGYMADYSLRELDLSTYRLVDEYSLTNYQILWDRPVFTRVFLRTLLAAVLVTVFSLLLAFPYAYVMVRTGSARLRKLLLIALFLPFFIGQVVRAYGWLILLGKQGLINEALGVVGIGPLDLLYNYGAVILGLVQYMLPFAVLMLAPALLLVGLLAIGMGWVAEMSLHELDPATYYLREAYSLANFGMVFGTGPYLDIIFRSTAAATIVTGLTLVLAFPYAYVMVRTPSRATRKALLVCLFLPFFIGQVVRAYGWLILLGKQGLINEALGVVGI
ncbi:MAG: hypothetical protein KDA49_16615, partial [Rhodospirillaceae bacterium]|nr:hypothetical protein [Rhodospirillaceae bacterium]